MSAAARVQRVVAELRERGLDRLLVLGATNLRYLTGFTGSNGVALIDASERAAHRFLTDFRYKTQSAEQLPDAFARRIVGGEMLEAVAEALLEDGAGGERLGFDDAATTVRQHERLAELLGGRFELVGAGGIVERLREVKDEREIAAIAAAAELADAALRAVLAQGLVGRDERDVALALEAQMRRLGAQAPSFPTIVAAGPHAALPHAEPRAVPIPAGVLVTIDWGVRLDGYCSDCTRTYATGALDERAREIYALVLQAQQAGLEAVRAGRSGKEVDAIARGAIEDAGHGEHFGHGLGHGVGMDIHEAPRLSRTASDDPLRAGSIVTVEPGVYLPDCMGVRIEDLVVVRNDSCDRLTCLPKELTVVR